MKDNTDAAAQAADDHWSEHGDQTPQQVWSRSRDQLRSNHMVEIFGSNTCTFCTKAKELCNKHFYEYTYYNIDEDEEKFDQLVGRIKSWKTVPQIFIGAIHLGGYDDLLKHLEPNNGDQ